MCHKISVGISTAKILRHSKKPSVGVELRVGGDPNRSKKLGWRKGNGLKKKMPRYPVSPKSFVLVQSSKMTNFNYDLFKVSKMCVCAFLWLKLI